LIEIPDDSKSVMEIEGSYADTSSTDATTTREPDKDFIEVRTDESSTGSFIAEGSGWESSDSKQFPGFRHH